MITKSLWNSSVPERRTFAVILSYCVFLWLTNWSIDRTYAQGAELTSSGIHMQGLGAVIGLLTSIIFARRIYKIIRRFLDKGIRIPRDVRIWGDWKLLLLLLPLGIQFTNRSQSVAADGKAVTTVFHYGGDLAGVSFLFSAVAIILYQVLKRLEEMDPDKLI